MTNFRVSRASLFESLDGEAGPTFVPDLEFEEVVVEAPDAAQGDEDDEEEGTFAFRLFGGDQTTTVTLKEEDEEEVRVERPMSFYRLIPSDSEKQQYAEAAITYAQLQVDFDAVPIDSCPWRVLLLAEHNAKIKTGKKREGKKKRVMKAVCRERREKREKARKKAEKSRAFGGYTRKTPRAPKQKKPVVEKPKYRTE